MSRFTRKLVSIIAFSAIAGLLFLGGARVINASAAQASLGGGSRVSEFEFSGTVQAMSEDSWTIGDRIVGIQPATEIKGSPTIGDQVKVHALLAADGSLAAREIESALPGTDSNDNGDDDNDNGDDDNDNGDDDNDNGDDDNDNGDDDNDNGDDDNDNGDDDNDNGDDDNDNGDDDNDNGDDNGNDNGG